MRQRWAQRQQRRQSRRPSRNGGLIRLLLRQNKLVLPPSLRSTPPSSLLIALTLIGLVHQVAERMQLEQELQQLTTEERVHSRMQQAMQRCSKPADDDRVCVVCLESPNTHLLAPCGHQCACSKMSVGQPCPVCTCRGICAEVFVIVLSKCS